MTFHGAYRARPCQSDSPELRERRASISRLGIENSLLWSQRDLKAKGASLPLSPAISPDPASMQFYKTPGQGQPESGTLVLAAGRAFDLLEGFENPFQVVRFNADAGVSHAHPYAGLLQMLGMFAI